MVVVTYPASYSKFRNRRCESIMADEQSPAPEPPRQEKVDMLRVASTPDKAQPPNLPFPPRTVKRPFGGAETPGKPLTKRSRADHDDEESRSQQQKPMALDAAMMNKYFVKAEKGELEEIKARMALATPSNPAGNMCRPLQCTEPTKLSVAGKPMAPNTLRDASPLPEDPAPEPRRDPLGSKSNPIIFSSGLEELDHEFREGSGYNTHGDQISFSSRSEHPPFRSKRQSRGRNGSVTGYQPRRRSSWSEERFHEEKLRENRRREDGNDRKATVRSTSLDSCDISPSEMRVWERSRSRSRSDSREKKDYRYRGDREERPQPHTSRQRDEIFLDHEREVYRAGSLHSPKKPQPPPRRQEKRANPRSRNRSRTVERPHIDARSSPSFLGADPLPDPHESLGVDRDGYTLEQHLVLFNLAIAMYVQRERVAELMLNRTRLQFDLENLKAGLTTRGGEERRRGS
jgi:hypothetical protein